jgi:transcriptional regulator with XRE-family HTH domain
VFSDEASAHIHQLVRLGWRQNEIARVTGLAPSTISQAKERGVMILAETSERILAVQPGQSRR